jgi:hypothetical protein
VASNRNGERAAAAPAAGCRQGGDAAEGDVYAVELLHTHRRGVLRVHQGRQQRPTITAGVGLAAAAARQATSRRQVLISTTPKMKIDHLVDHSRYKCISRPRSGL